MNAGLYSYFVKPGHFKTTFADSDDDDDADNDNDAGDEKAKQREAKKLKRRQRKDAEKAEKKAKKKLAKGKKTVKAERGVLDEKESEEQIIKVEAQPPVSNGVCHAATDKVGTPRKKAKRKRPKDENDVGETASEIAANGASKPVTEKIKKKKKEKSNSAESSDEIGGPGREENGATKEGEEFDVKETKKGVKAKRRRLAKANGDGSSEDTAARGKKQKVQETEAEGHVSAMSVAEPSSDKKPKKGKKKKGADSKGKDSQDTPITALSNGTATCGESESTVVVRNGDARKTKKSQRAKGGVKEDKKLVQKEAVLEPNGKVKKRKAVEGGEVKTVDSSREMDGNNEGGIAKAKKKRKKSALAGEGEEENAVVPAESAHVKTKTKKKTKKQAAA